jgi:DNA polymerase III epsilon subunit-like protein
MIDKRKKYYLMIDTETCNGIMTEKGLDLTQSLVYDIGCAIVDKRGNIYDEQSFVIIETFIGMKDVMQSAYYAKKIPMYWEDIKNGKRQLVALHTARTIILEMVKKYNAEIVVAHNAGFDLRALNNTQRYISKSKYRYFFPYGFEWWDTLKMANDIYGNQPSYRRYCERHGYMTRHKKPRPRMTAEILHRYLTGNEDFEESHTGLEDVKIESQIFAQCMRQNKKMRKALFN